MENREISQAVVSRLPRYYRYLGDLKDQGIERISSAELSRIMRVTASQIRQDFNHFGGFGQQKSQDYSETEVHMQAVRNFISSRHYQEALRLLSEIEEHSGLWYYYSALANSGIGNNVTAKQHASMAVQIEPDNLQYRQLVSQLENPNAWYRGMGETYGAPVEMGGDWCTRLCLANLLCNCLCGGRFIMC